MARATGYAVGKVCEAQAKLWEAADLITSARLDVVRLSGDGEEDFRGTPVERELDRIGGALTDSGYNLDAAIRELAALIPEPVPTTSRGEQG